MRSTFFSWLLCISVLLLANNYSRAQDSLRIVDYSDNFILRVYTLTKFNLLTIENPQVNRALKLEPNGVTNLGIGFNYKKVGVGLTFGLPQSAESKRIYGSSSRFDLQGSIYGSKLGGDGYLQYYKGYYNANPGDFIDWSNEEFPQLSDMRVLSLGLSPFYIFNSNRYSYRAAFVRDEMQKVQAGSFLLGVFVYYDDARTENGFIPQEFPDSTKSIIDLKEISNLAIGVSAGYAHNFIFWKNLIIGVAVIPGFGYQRVHVRDLNDLEGIENQPVAQVLIKASIGYDIGKLYFSSQGSVNFRNISYKIYEFGLSTEQFRVVAGYRFGL